MGSIEEVNKKISRLDRKLQSYTDLIVESRASQLSDAGQQAVANETTPRDAYMQRGKAVYNVLLC